MSDVEEIEKATNEIVERLHSRAVERLHNGIQVGTPDEYLALCMGLLIREIATLELRVRKLERT